MNQFEQFIGFKIGQQQKKLQKNLVTNGPNDTTLAKIKRPSNCPVSLYNNKQKERSLVSGIIRHDKVESCRVKIVSTLFSNYLAIKTTKPKQTENSWTEKCGAHLRVRDRLSASVRQQLINNGSCDESNWQHSLERVTK